MLPTVLCNLILLAGAFSVATAADTTFSFSDCASDCVGNSGCGTNRPTCMCLAAKGSLLDTVIQCMSNKCPDSLGTVESDFLNPIQVGCTAISQPIPAKDIQEADAIASSLAAKLNAATTTEAPQTTSTTAEPTPTTTTTAEAETTSESQTPSSTEAPSPTETEEAATSSAGAAETEAPISTTTAKSKTTTLIVDSSTPSTASKDSSTKTKGASNSDPTDSSPFATPNSSPKVSGSYLIMALPLAVDILVGLF